MEQALKGITVLDLTHHVAGPFATKLLAGYGAEVIKIEPPWGEATRGWGPFPNDEPDPEKSGFFLYLNTGKKDVTLNLKTETGRLIFKELVQKADAVVENFFPGVLPSLGLSWDTLRSINTELVLVSISSFGASGPYRDYEATELIALAMGGQMSVTGESDREPLKNFGHQAEYQAGYQAFGATLAALYGAMAHGEGEHVDISIQEVQASALEMTLPNALNHGMDAYRTGNTIRATWGIYPCKDGHVGIASLDRNLPAVFRAIGRPELVETYSDPAARARDNDVLEAMIFAWCGERSKKEIFEVAVKERAPFGYLPDVEELLEWPALSEDNFWVELDHPLGGSLTYPGGPFMMSATPCVLRRAPLLGEHNGEVLGGLGYSREDLRQLRQQRVI